MSVDPLSLASVAAPAPASPDAVTRGRIASAAREFESLFMLQMLRQMRQSMIDDGGDAGDEKGLGAATMTDTFDVELARQLSGRPGGLTPMLMTALTKTAGLADAGGETTPSGPAVSLDTIAPVPAQPLAPVATPAPVVAPPTSGTAAGADTVNRAAVSSGFGWRKDPFTGAPKFHRGVDLRLAYGEPVGSAADGTVTFAGNQRGYGEIVVVQHADGIETRYAHLSQIDVAKGDQVTAGQLIGRVGQSGRATGPHLHYEVREDGQEVDPRQVGGLLTPGFKLSGDRVDYLTGSSRSGRGDVTGAQHED